MDRRYVAMFANSTFDIRIERVRRFDAGTYECQIVGSSPTTKFIHLKVKGKGKRQHLFTR